MVALLYSTDHGPPPHRPPIRHRLTAHRFATASPPTDSPPTTVHRFITVHRFQTKTPKTHRSPADNVQPGFGTETNLPLRSRRLSPPPGLFPHYPTPKHRKQYAHDPG
jgi:hypothetical protein